ncbi:lysylphosphatidylglycerol synthase transmembrane domain-containing protein [Parabacteroides pacaensis]|uniref:lysylphosphatidylglycerol synthase transmembrane domain-containing protein n=1 Tax=Parabacteroides pacaensis TaxID=2086575 RepID=UPI000D0E9B57|nr:lysylphosphatidylglycerol synthase transmembrane domain-containing protein [Parabacteroides pacaensis]
MDLKSILRTILKVFIPLAFGGLLLWILYRKVDIREIIQIIKNGVRYDVLLFSLIFGLLANIIRAFRWKLLINSLGDQPRTMNVVWAVLGNYAVNLILPRVGEIWRCGVIRKYDKISFTQLLGTLVVDRTADTLMVALITLGIFVFNIGFFISFFAKNPMILDGFYSMFTSIWIYVVIIIMALFIWVIFTYMRNFTLVVKAKNILKNVWVGIKSIWYLKQKGLFLVYTIGIWSGYFLFFYTTFYAFGFTEHLGLVVGLIAFAMSSIGVAVPVQGGIGTWHFMVISTLVCFGVTDNDAAAFAFIVYSVQTVWTALIGLVGVIALPISNRQRIVLTNN